MPQQDFIYEVQCHEGIFHLPGSLFLFCIFVTHVSDQTNVNIGPIMHQSGTGYKDISKSLGPLENGEDLEEWWTFSGRVYQNYNKSALTTSNFTSLS